MEFLPFESDLQYLAAEFVWIGARADRLDTQLIFRGDTADHDPAEASEPRLTGPLEQFCQAPGNQVLRPQLIEIDRRSGSPSQTRRPAPRSGPGTCHRRPGVRRTWT